jgi:hypothetical protein
MDDSDYFGLSEQNETRTVAERYIGKSDTTNHTQDSIDL